MIPVFISSVALSNKGFIVFLKEQQGERSLPIFIGPLEAKSIASQLNKEDFPRPLTHDLFKNTMDELGARITHIEVCDLHDNTFFGKVFLEHSGVTHEIDSRPSDAIALALRFGADAYVAEHVMEEAGEVIEEESQAQEPQQQEDDEQQARKKEQEEYENLSELDKMKKDLEKAIEQERYEEAAKLRDKINEVQNSGN